MLSKHILETRERNQLLIHDYQTQLQWSFWADLLQICNDKTVITQPWIFLQSSISFSMLLLNNIWPSVCKSDIPEILFTIFVTCNVWPAMHFCYCNLKRQNFLFSHCSVKYKQFSFSGSNFLKSNLPKCFKAKTKNTVSSS